MAKYIVEDIICNYPLLMDISEPGLRTYAYPLIIRVFQIVDLRFDI